MFIRYKNITNEETIDVRSKSEFDSMKIFSHNIPIINEEEHALIKKFYPIAIFIIIRSLIKNKEFIKNKLIYISNNGNTPIIIGCSRGRLRSPIVFIYSRIIGLNKSKILLGGLKPIYLKNKKL